MSVIETTAAEFGLGPVVFASPAAGGIGESYRVVTTEGAFHVKRWEGATEELALVAELDASLMVEGLGVAPLLALPDGTYIASTGYIVTPWLDGVTRRDHSETALQSFGSFFAHYNLVLRDLPPPVWLARRWSPWDRADNLDFMLRVCRPRLAEMGLPAEQRALCESIYGALESQQGLIQQLPRQLVHGDANAENALFDGDTCLAIIDFTPYYDSHAYSFAVMVYHWCVYGRARPDRERLLRLYDAYRAAYPWSAAERDGFPALMLRAVGRMVSVPMAFWLASDQPRSPLQIYHEEFESCATTLRHLEYFALPSE